jgi:hypothetical protein
VAEDKEIVFRENGFVEKQITRDLVLESIRKTKAQDMTKKIIQAKNKFSPSREIASKIDDFAREFLPHQPTEQESIGDFAGYFLPSDDVFSTTGSGSDMSWGFSEFQYLAERRIGLGPRLTWMPAQDAVRNRFKFLKLKGHTVEDREDILDFLEQRNFFEELSLAIYFERVYGVGFLVALYSKNDKDADLSTEPTGKPVGFKAYSPLYMWPTNYHEFPNNPEKWKVRGQDNNSSIVNEKRVYVFISRPVEYRWWGRSIFEAIWYPLVCYFMAQIFVLRQFSRLGNSSLFVKVAENIEYDALWEKWGELLQSQRMNGMMVLKQGDDIGVLESKIGTGLKELVDLWLEDISAGSGIPVPLLVGRVVASGLGNNGYAIMERYNWNTISKIQHSFNNEIIRLITQCGFDMKGYRLDWTISIVKTDQQRLQDEAMEKQNQLLDGEIEMQELQKGTMRLQNEALEIQNITALMNPEGVEEKPPKQSAKDFDNEYGKVYEEYKKRKLWLMNRQKALFEEIYGKEYYTAEEVSKL